MRFRVTARGVKKGLVLASSLLIAAGLITGTPVMVFPLPQVASSSKDIVFAPGTVIVDFLINLLAGYIVLVAAVVFLGKQVIASRRRFREKQRPNKPVTVLEQRAF